MNSALRRLLTSLAPVLLGPIALGQQSEVNLQIGNREPTWVRGDIASVVFTASSLKGGSSSLLGDNPRALAFLYQSFEPDPFLSSPYPPAFLGGMEVPGEAVFPAYLNPDRNPINEFTRERFFQGALCDAETGELLALSNVIFMNIDYEDEPQSYLVDFETEDDFQTPLLNGQDISPTEEFGRLFLLSGTGPGHFGPAIFDSSPRGPNENSQDQDLLVGTGNVLIFQSNGSQSQPGFFDFPNDFAGGGTFLIDYAVLDLTRQVEPKSIDLIDVEKGAGVIITLTDVLARQRVYNVPGGWTRDIAAQGPPGYGTLDLSTLQPQPGFASTAVASQDEGFVQSEVSRISIELMGSGAIDNLLFQIEADPQPVQPPTPSRIRLSRGPGSSPPLR